MAAINVPRLKALDGFKFLCHVWVVAVHCLPSLSYWDGFMRNLDAGSFFVITGLTSHISLNKAIANAPEGQADLKTLGRWLVKRITLIALLGLLFTIGSWLSFPMRELSRPDLLPYLMTFTYPFIQHFDRDRDNWHPNPPIWFIDICIWLWLIHPAAYMLLTRDWRSSSNWQCLAPSPISHDEIEFCDVSGTATAPTSSPEIDDTPIPRLPGQINNKYTQPFLRRGESTNDLEISLCIYFALIGILLTMIVLEKDNARLKTGWSYHWAPRFLQYAFGVWAARVVMSDDIKQMIVDPKTWLGRRQDKNLCSRLLSTAFAYTCAQRWILRFMPDVIFAGLAGIYFCKPYRFDADWADVWMPRSMAITPCEAVLIVSFLYAEYMSENTDGTEQNQEKSTGPIENAGLEEGEIALFPSPPQIEFISARSRVFAHFRKRVLSNNNSVLTSIWSAEWYGKVAPGLTNSVTYLAHFPLVWRPLYGKNEVMTGHKSILFVLPLWWFALLVNTGGSKLQKYIIA